MESKRMKFALFTCVFALYGCVSSTGANPVIRKNASNNNNKTSMMTADAVLNTINPMEVMNAKDMSTLAFEANVLHADDAVIFRNLRDRNGILLSKGEFERISKLMVKSAKEEKERKDYLAKEEAERQRLQEEADKLKGTFTPRITTYGVDCHGCKTSNGRGGTAMGVALDLNMGVQMPDGSWQPGIMYGNYYIIAADPSIPMCSIVKISNHGLSGSGITPDQPYFGIVLDRGGAIRGGHLDLYIGSEQSRAIFSVQRTTPSAEIIRLGGQNGNTCAL